MPDIPVEVAILLFLIGLGIGLKIKRDISRAYGYIDGYETAVKNREKKLDMLHKK